MKASISGRFIIFASLLVLAMVAVYGRGDREQTPPHPSLDTFPTAIGSWDGVVMTLPKRSLEVLGNGEFMARRYVAANTPTVDLFIAYFPTQRTGQTIHSPKNCLPGAGWIPLESQRIALTIPNHDPLHVNRYVLGNGLQRQLVFYWYQAHSRTVASEYWARYYLVADSIRFNRSDGALVRVSTLQSPSESMSQTEARVRDFLGQAASQIDAYLPR